MKEFMQSPLFDKLIWALGALLIALVIFAAGMMVGYRKAEFSFQWQTHYADMFGGEASPFAITGDTDDNAPTSHGAFGQVVAVDMPTVTVKGPREAEKVIVIGPETAIRRFRGPATSTDIVVGESVVAIGEPDSQGRIMASLIRIMPPPPRSATGTPATAPPAMTPPAQSASQSK